MKIFSTALQKNKKQTKNKKTKKTKKKQTEIMNMLKTTVLGYCHNFQKILEAFSE